MTCHDLKHEGLASFFAVGVGKDLDAIFDLVDYEDSYIVEIEVHRRNTWQCVGKVVWTNTKS